MTWKDGIKKEAADFSRGMEAAKSIEGFIKAVDLDRAAYPYLYDKTDDLIENLQKDSKSLLQFVGKLIGEIDRNFNHELGFIADGLMDEVLELRRQLNTVDKKLQLTLKTHRKGIIELYPQED